MDKVPNNIKRIANDYNPFLIAMWVGLQLGVDKPMEIPKPLYDEYRNKYNQCKDRLDKIRTDVIVMSMGDLESFNNNNDFIEYFLIGWIGFMGSFNGRFYDGGYSGKTETRDYIAEQIKNTLKQVPYIQDEKMCFISCSYENIILPPNSIIYCDPPYADTKQYAFSKAFDYDKFWDWCRRKTEDGHKVFISEYKAPEDFKCIWEKEVTNSLNTTKTYKPIERLFTLS